MMNAKLHLISAVVSDRGLSQKRPVNEDSFLALVDAGLFAVADGVGGAQAGDFASQTAMEVLQQAFSHLRSGVDPEELLEMAIQRANESIFQMTQELPQFEMMATTIVALHLNGNIATIGHVGDSRLYRLAPDGVLTRETDDHSIVAEEVRAGRMTEAQAANHPSRNVISRALGAESAVEVEMRTIMFEPDTTFLLCSDGITRHVADAEIKTILNEFESLEDACAEFKRLCYERGAEDNLTALVVRAQTAPAANFAASADENTFVKPNAQTIDAEEDTTIVGNNGKRGAPPDLNTKHLVAPSADVAAQTVPLDAQIVDNSNDFAANPPRTLESAKHAAHPQIAPEAIAAAPTNAATKSTHSISNADAIEKTRNERAAAPTAAATGKWLNSLLLLIAGAALGAGILYGLMMLAPPAANAPTTVSTSDTVAPAPQNAQSVAPAANQPNNAPNAAQSGEFASLEAARRSIDSQPQGANQIVAQPQTAVDYYLLGRAALQIGDYDRARAAFKQAENLLPELDNSNQEIVRVDLATAQAALSALTKKPEDARALNELIKAKRAEVSDARKNEPNLQQ